MVVLRWWFFAVFGNPEISFGSEECLEPVLVGNSLLFGQKTGPKSPILAEIQKPLLKPPGILLFLVVLAKPVL